MTIKCKMSPMGKTTNNKVKLTINTVPANATVTLTAAGSTQSGNSITVNPGTTISYIVSASGYTSKSGQITLSSSTTLTISLSSTSYTLTINTTPSNATVKITADGSTTTGKTRTLASGTTYSYTVSATNYEGTSGQGTLTANTTLNVKLNTNSIIELTESGSQSFTINETAYYDVIIIAGGAGGCSMTSYGNISTCSGGGSGSGFVGILKLPAGTCTVTCGAGGAKDDEVITPLTPYAIGETGGNSTIIVGNTTCITCYGGTGGKVATSTGTKGSGGSIPIIDSNITYSGNLYEGNSSNAIRTTGSTGSTSSKGGDGIYTGNIDYGAGGKGMIAAGMGASKNGNDGYIKIQFNSYL